MNDLLKQLTALAPLAETATAEPWEVIPNSDHTDSVHSTEANHVENFGLGEFRSSNLCMNTGGFAHDMDAAFIVAARNVLTPENLQALCAALNKPVAEAMGAAEAKYFAHLSELSPSLLLAEWNATEEVSHFDPESYKPEYVRLLLQALCAALAPQWVAVTERMPEESGVYLVFGNCTGKDDLPPTEDMARFYIESATFSKYRQPTHWMPLPTAPETIEGAQPNE